MYKVQLQTAVQLTVVYFTLLLPSVDSSGEKDISEEVYFPCDEGHYLQIE
jgi:hypothetical protein